MSKTATNIKGTEIIVKGNVDKNYEKFPMELYDYLEVGLISHKDMAVYMKLYQLYNSDYGYAFPTIPQLMIRTCIGSKITVHNCLNTLEKVGLIQKKKTNRGNNIYLVYKPLDKTKLYECVPDKAKKLKEKETKLMTMAEDDKNRLIEHRKNTEEKEIIAKRIIPNIAPKVKSLRSEAKMTFKDPEPLDEDSDEYFRSIGMDERMIRAMNMIGVKSE